MIFFKIIGVTIGFIILIVLYLNNESNRTILGIIFDSFWINWLIIFYILLIHLSKKISLSDKFHAIKKFESSGILYSIIGVKYYKYLLEKNPLPTLTAKLFLKNKSRNSLIKLENEMRTAEAVHIIAFILSLIIMILFSYLRDIRFIYFMIIFNILLNLYPFFVQRYNRNRIHRILKLANNR